MNSLVGYTGFVGSNIYASGSFDAAYNTRNIKDSYGTSPDLLVFAGLRAEKYLADNDQKKDMSLICEAEENISKIAPKRIVLISTIDVFNKPFGVDESSSIDESSLNPYGYDRYQFEKWVRDKYAGALIVRLPGLYGRNIKKNFIYDYINRIPFMLNSNKYSELASRDPEIKRYYVIQPNGFYKVNVDDNDRTMLRDRFEHLGFSALDFTDSRSVFQFYDLFDLWADIQTAMGAGLTVWHPATEPVSAGELYHYLSGKEFVNELKKEPAYYDYRTRYADVFGGKGGYIYGKKRVLEKVKTFVEGELAKA